MTGGRGSPFDPAVVGRFLQVADAFKRESEREPALNYFFEMFSLGRSLNRGNSRSSRRIGAFFSAIGRSQ